MRRQRRLEARAQALAEATDGWLHAHEGRLLFGLARRVTGRGAIVEVGSYHGKSTTWLACGSRAGRGGTVYAVDVWDGSGEPDAAFVRQIRNAGVEKVVTPIAAPSEDAAARFDQPVELVFIDGDHSYEGVNLDLDVWLPKVIDGGVLAFHDSIQWPGVARMLSERVLPSPEFDAGWLCRSITAVRRAERPGLLGRLRMRAAAGSFERKRARHERRRAAGRPVEPA